jgi:carbamoyltransferase
MQSRSSTCFEATSWTCKLRIGRASRCARIPLARWLARRHGARGFHQLGSDFASADRARAGKASPRRDGVSCRLGLSGTHNSGVALVEVTQANGPRLIVNNEEERFSGTSTRPNIRKPRSTAWLQPCVAWDARSADIDAWLTSWDYPTLAGTMVRSVMEELPQSLRLLRLKDASAFDGRRLDQMTRSPKAIARQLGVSKPVPLICMPHHGKSRLVFLRGLAVCR